MPINKLSKYFFSQQSLTFGAGIVLFFSACLMNLKLEKPIIQLSKQDSAININKDLLIFVSAGNKRLITDLLWVQTLIESDLEHYSNKDLNNWLYLRFNTISVLDPNFYENYSYGGQFLAIVKDDLEGADNIYDKGLKVFPQDYVLNYNAGFLNYFEIGDSQKGLKHLKVIEDHPRSPLFLKSIINKLKLDSGYKLEEVFKLVLVNYESARDEKLKIKLRGDLYSLKAEIDLKCLNNKRSNCETTDLDNNPYILRQGVYYAPKVFLPYRINRQGGQKSPRKPVDTFK